VNNYYYLLRVRITDTYRYRPTVPFIMDV